MTYNIFSGANRWQIPDFLSNGNCNVRSQNLRDNRKTIKMQKKLYLENEGQGQGGERRDLHRSTRNVQFHIDDFFS